MLDDVIVAIGSAKDCENLVEKFLKLGDASFRFADFARVWKESHFELIFWWVKDVEYREIVVLF